MSLILANFPSLTGKFSVGCHDIEWRNKKPVDINGEPSAKSVLMRLYYPAHIKKGDHKANWITHSQYAKGLYYTTQRTTCINTINDSIVRHW
jgi:hypothetical protein